ncbi:MAG: tail-specific protease [Deltaproteobacteria bacterium]|nr:tail-specific protease [Deltaproteobacteria bacterium]
MAARPRPGATAAGLSFLVFVFTVVPMGARAALTCSDIPDLTTFFFQKHITAHQLDDSIRRRSVETYVKRLDPQRILFLEDERAKLEEELLGLFLETRSSDCSRLRRLHQDVVGRNREVEGFVRGFVARDDYDLDTGAELQLDPDDRGSPATKDERDALLRTLIHFQVSNYLEADEDLEDAKRRLVHRYELLTKRVEELSREDLYSAFLDAFASALDPHSSYLSPHVWEDFQIQMQLSLEGIGVALSERDGYAVVEQIIPGGATDRIKALEPGDRIIAVAEEGKDSVDIIDMALRDVVRLIRGRKGTRVQLTVLRQGDRAERFNVAIERDKIDLEEQAAKLRVETVEVEGRTLRLGVLDLPSFYGGDRDPAKRLGSRDVRRLLAEVRREELDGLLLDLSRNGGGLLEDAVTISGFFIREGGVVAVRDGSQRSRVLPDPDDGVLYDGPLVILTSRISASASEILAGALKDYGRAVVVGDDHTFGKGTVQSLFPLRPGLGALKVTTGLFFRPGGHSTQHSGVAADVALPSLFATDEFGESAQAHSLRAPSIDPFVGPRANASGENAWTPITGELVAELAQRSERRQSGNEFFGEVREELAKRAEDDGVVHLAELIAQRESSQAGETGEPGLAAGTASAAVPEKAKKDSDELSPQAKEALNVLMDLVLLTK